MQKLKTQLAVAQSKQRQGTHTEVSQMTNQLRDTGKQFRNIHHVPLKLEDKAVSLEQILPGHVDNNDNYLTTPIEQEIREIEQTLSQLQQSFEQEEIDTEWASNFESDIVNKFDNNAAEGISLIDVQCRSSFCRIVVDDNQADGNLDLHMLIAEKMTKGVGFFHSTIDENGYKTTELYISRNGYSLPISQEAVEN